MGEVGIVNMLVNKNVLKLDVSRDRVQITATLVQYDSVSYNIMVPNKTHIYKGEVILSPKPVSGY